MRKRKQFSREFRKEAVRFLEEGRKSGAPVSSALSVRTEMPGYLLRGRHKKHKGRKREQHI